jgi:hypothetical protein
VPVLPPSPPNLLTTTTTREIIRIMTTTPKRAKNVTALPKKDEIPLETFATIDFVPLSANEFAGAILADWIEPKTIRVTTPIIAKESNTTMNALTVFNPRIDFLLKDFILHLLSRTS